MPDGGGGGGRVSVMATKDVSDRQVCLAVARWNADREGMWPYELLMGWTGEPFKVCWRAMERADKRGLLDYGVSLRTAWLTEKGRALIGQPEEARRDVGTIWPDTFWLQFMSKEEERGGT